jgi:hypothetical protein
MEESVEAQVHSRRGVLGRGLALAGAVAALGIGSAFANNDDDDKDKDKDKDDNRGRGRGRDNDDDDRPRPTPVPVARLNAFRSDLCRIADVTADFSSGNPGTDALVDGRIRLRARRGTSDDARAGVTLHGALANASYEVFFQPFLNGKGRESLGTVGPTDSRGNLNARTPTALTGNHRVGVFTLVRDGKDQFVSCMGG